MALSVLKDTALLDYPRRVYIEDDDLIPAAGMAALTASNAIFSVVKITLGRRHTLVNRSSRKNFDLCNLVGSVAKLRQQCALQLRLKRSLLRVSRPVRPQLPGLAAMNPIKDDGLRCD
jgi:hypothetical protein